ncbi:Planctomycete cytochrome C [Aquiflexum balticum DSM 16537]|uniref:Planctomycete cytochrome C n=2 Tax=Aquiflexum TaxID=280472 RepID=A0A1W2HBX1_9BACT|nr:Planctomycete cytochrome C [Aquiflexum balticum DSM 16537]
MFMPKRKLTGFLTAAMLLLIAGILVFRQSDQVDFSTEVKPILNKNCISCHGGVKKNGGFSVLFEEEALALTKSGVAAIIPGDPKNSELIKRLHEEDPELRMPYHRASLTDEEIQTLHKWIKQGAKWGKHWAYTPVEKPKLNWTNQKAGFSDSKKQYQGIDFFVHEKQKENKLTFSEEEDSKKLLRRVSLDITGLPPTEALQNDWLTGKITYEQLVDRLLDSPSFGEKWASWWLDLARYADTKGYERDVSRTMWKYRDWVIKAFNEDKPFDEFTIEQLAGDLLPNPTQEQLIATAFHRNTMNNDEGGTQDEEFRVAAVLDRVNTTFEVWQSTTMACVQCHSHPYDPFKHEEYFQLTAFFNNTRDEDTHDEEPKLRFYEGEDLEKISSILSWVNSNGSQKQAEALHDFFNFREPKYHAHLCEDFVNGELIDTKWLGLWHDGSCYLRNVDTQGADQLLMHYNSGLDGTKISIRNGGPEGEILSQFTIDKTSNVTKSFPFKKLTAPVDLYIEADNPKASPQQSTSAVTWFAFVNSLPGKEQKGYQEINDRFYSVLKSKVPSLPIIIENPSFMQRKTHVFERGNWLLHGEEVKPKTPEALNAWNPEWPNNRLGLAYWLTDIENPLTSRTLVNRIWDQLFGRGLISSIEDMGTQSEAPSHPELLDFLSYNFMNEMDWSIKKLIKTIVLSKTYRQKSTLSPELYQQDPRNKWYARGPRIRLSSEQIRDQALYVSGLLSPEMYGPPVMPFQPEGIWETVYNGESWKLSEGEDKHRRAVYTFLKRTSPYPSFITFDAGSREVCVSKRIVTNTPLQALVTLNDPVFLEAAFHLGQKMKNYSDNDSLKGIAFGYELCVISSISQSKMEILHSLYKEALSEYEKKPELIAELIPDEANENSAELAAFTVVANALLNLDEFLTKP